MQREKAPSSDAHKLKMVRHRIRPVARFCGSKYSFRRVTFLFLLYVKY